jgi:hypothetical protein
MRISAPLPLPSTAPPATLQLFRPPSRLFLPDLKVRPVRRGLQGLPDLPVRWVFRALKEQRDRKAPPALQVPPAFRAQRVPLERLVRPDQKVRPAHKDPRALHR